MRRKKDLYRAVCVTFSLALGAYLANAQVTYTCDSTVAASTCNYLNTTTAGHYSSTFSNANASIYIRFGNTGLGSSVGSFNFMTYAQYVAALGANTHRSPVQTAALSALDILDAGPYGGGDVEITCSWQGSWSNRTDRHQV